MKWIIDFYDKRKLKFIFITTLFLLILFTMPFITTRRMNIRAPYTKKEDVALYIIQYHELPPNYITKYGYDYVENHNLNNYEYVIGGDTHINLGSLGEFGVAESTKLKECDISNGAYSANNNRGAERLVYTTNTKKARVFYTSNHYKDFVELTEFKLQITRNVFWIIFGCYTIIFIAFYVCVYTVKKRNGIDFICFSKFGLNNK